MRIVSLVSSSILLWVNLACAHDMAPNPMPTTPVALINGTIHPVSRDPIQNGTILFEDGEIIALGESVDVPANAETIDVDGKHIYPGLISSNSSLGLIEINAVRATLDLIETGLLNPNARAETAVNPDSELIPVTRANGVLVAHVSPRTRREGLIAGSTAAMVLDGWTYEEMTVAAPVCISVSWPAVPREPGFNLNRKTVHDAKKAEEDYARKIETLEDAFNSARAYWKAKAQDAEATDVDLRWASLKPVLDRDIPVMVRASALRAIRDAIEWAAREDIRIILLGAGDAWRLADVLAEREIPVILSAVNALPRRRWEPYDTAFVHATKLSEAGVPFAIGYPYPASERNLPYEAAKAVAHGLSPAEALKAITLYPAQILGIDDRLGSLETGKDATLIVTNGDPLDIRTHVEMAYIQGRPVNLASRHTQLYEKYQKKYDRE